MPKSKRPASDVRRHIFLVGFSGSGKSTVGPILARRLKAPFFDSDKLIEKRAGLSIANLFARDGEQSFRELEYDVVSALASRKGPSVIALGGGALLRKKTEGIVFASGRVAYLRCAMSEIERRLSAQKDRPLLHRKGDSLHQRIRKLLPLRKPRYKKADITITTTARTASQAADEILKKLGEMEWH